MSFEIPENEPSPQELLMKKARENLDDFSNEDAAALFLVSPSDLRYIMQRHARKGRNKKFSFRFNMGDLGADKQTKSLRLKQIRELTGSAYRDFVESVVVRGTPEDRALGGNTWASGIQFEENE
jgi:hypothetical protein